ncbi:LysR family transcriptional regulator [Sphingomonas bacterium]|uniref:LysR family transcriptional regulator n=1 Tax=Sphingomonas bacterium TaxID=1895847 RepID=UPI00157768DD|nr:LysR family transcriptional regulator [Sphingomonas bacterium]
MARPSIADLTAFATVAEHRSFREAADMLGVSRSTLSHAIIGLERRLGVRLLNRTTRSVAPTEAGEKLLRRLGPLLREFDATLDLLADDGGVVGGTLRINCGENGAEQLLRLVVPAFLQRYPDVALDLVTDGRLIDIVAGGFDAGVRLRESVPQDMIIVPFGGDVRFLAVASPDYLARHGTPSVPDDLSRHRCIRHRMPSGKAYRWEFEKHGQEMVVDVPGSLTLDHTRLMTEAAADGLGIAYVPQSVAAARLAAGTLVPVLEDWCPAIPGLCLYYPGHRHVRAALRAFIDMLRQVD